MRARRPAAYGLLATSLLVLGAVAPTAAADPEVTDPEATEPGPAAEETSAPDPGPAVGTEPAPAPAPGDGPEDGGPEPGVGQEGDAPAESPAAAPPEEPAADEPGEVSLSIEAHDLLPELVPDDEQVTWNYLVTNDGDVDVTDLVLTDSTGAHVDCPATDLAPGEWMICHVTAVPGDH